MGKPASQCIDVTYQKQTCNDPAAPHVSHGQEDWSRLRNHQQNFLRTTTEPTRFRTIALLEDLQAIRAVAFHPTGKLFAIGSNSKILRICASPDLENFTNSDRNASQIPPPPTILFKRTRHHRGSIYCMAWSSTGDLIATGSNDKSIKVLHFDADNCTQVGPELELNIHSGTIRDLSFVSRASGSAVLVSGGAGNGNIQISDCTTGNTIGQLKGHSSHIMSVYAAKDDIIASGSNDNTVRLWDLRSQRCIDAIATGDSCVSSVCVNPSGTLLVSGHEDGGCMLYDITAGRTLQFFKPHTADCRSVRFSPDGHHLLSCSYDTSTILMEMQHDLECNIPPYSVVAQHDDKMIQCRWHPFLMAFVSSSADRTARLWTLDC
ncbi:predicted protein [Nematostella vectensis]|uniref:Anaphase-promoting complex subunit 4-like WD40 domain-containing protein n=1 Tax=Nematostella vectensis TaxID=45351 RepID=A7RYT9_NEMVE|nr:predicted protein [Nematostella vectensis]|eukprot:XP_001635481.1 predicted protein [Nematostella vectensis]